MIELQEQEIPVDLKKYFKPKGVGFTLRNTIIWHKPNQMPHSAKDRYTVDFEKIFFFTKQATGYYFEQQLEAFTSSEKDIKRAKKNDGDYDLPYAQSKRSVGGVGYGNGGRNKRTVWSINTKPFRDAHFATYPEELVGIMVKSGCPEGGIVLDPFMGAGTTAIVAKKLNRDYVGIELNPEYLKIAENRINKEFGFFL